MAFAPACVLDAVGLDQPAVDRSLLVGVAGGRQVREEVRSVGESLAVEPGIELVQDLLPGVQALGVYPGLQVGIPGLAGLAPFRLRLPQPARVIPGSGQPGEAPAGSGLIDRSRAHSTTTARPPGTSACAARSSTAARSATWCSDVHATMASSWSGTACRSNSAWR